MKIKQNIPNAITSLNLVCGVLSLIETMNGNFVGAALFILLAAVLDFLDGSAARWLNARSEIGKQLDSLADVVSFGVAPGLIVFSLLRMSCVGGCNIFEKFIPYFALLIPVFSALRLAKFNIDTRQEVNFIGLPTPANAIFFASIPLILFLEPESMALIPLDFLKDFFANTRVLGILTVLFSYLLISDFSLFSMKMKSFSWKENQVKYYFLILSLLMLVLFSYQAIPFVIGLYLTLSLIFKKKF